MGHFVGVYTDELPKLRSVIGSKSADHFETVLKACGGKFDAAPLTHDRIAAALREFIAGSYPAGELEEGHYYVYAFQNFCRTFAKKWTVVEIYVDDEQFPEISSFVWGGVSDEEDLPLLDSDPFRLPTGRYGPVCWHRPLAIVKQEIETLDNLDYDELAATSGTDYRQEVAAILEVLRFAEQQGHGVFVTFME